MIPERSDEVRSHGRTSMPASPVRPADNPANTLSPFWEPLRPSTAVVPWLVIGATASLLAAGIAFSDLSLEAGAFAVPLLIAIGAVLCIRVVRPPGPLHLALHAVPQLTSFYALATPLSYAVASADAPLSDAKLLTLDRVLGFDWLAYVSMVEAHPWLGLSFKLAYGSLLPQLIILVLLGCRLQRPDFCIELNLALMISALVTIAISGLLPAMANYVHLGLTVADFPNLAPESAFVHVHDLIALRSGSMHRLSLAGENGIITFPSYHAALAVIFGTRFWSFPRFRWPGLALNGVMLAAAPVYGGHYLVDVLAGSVVAFMAIRASAAFTRRDGKAFESTNPLPLAAGVDAEI